MALCLFICLGVMLVITIVLVIFSKGKNGSKTLTKIFEFKQRKVFQ